jgi:hypothetical protein
MSHQYIVQREIIGRHIVGGREGCVHDFIEVAREDGLPTGEKVTLADLIPEAVRGVFGEDPGCLTKLRIRIEVVE